MEATCVSPRIDATTARRATGAIIFAVFGAAWLGLWEYLARPGMAAAVVIVVSGLALLAGAWMRYRRHAPALAQQPMTPERKRANRIFYIVNNGQWIVMVVLGNVLNNTGHGDWVLPMILFVLGLHFLPIAHVFRNASQYLTGAALMVLAAAYPVLAAGGPKDPVGALGAGLILWLSALWALRPQR